MYLVCLRTVLGNDDDRDLFVVAIACSGRASVQVGGLLLVLVESVCSFNVVIEKV